MFPSRRLREDRRRRLEVTSSFRAPIYQPIKEASRFRFAIYQPHRIFPRVPIETCLTVALTSARRLYLECIYSLLLDLPFPFDPISQIFHPPRVIERKDVRCNRPSLSSFPLVSCFFSFVLWRFWNRCSRLFFVEEQ